MENFMDIKDVPAEFTLLQFAGEETRSAIAWEIGPEPKFWLTDTEVKDVPTELSAFNHFLVRSTDGAFGEVYGLLFLHANTVFRLL